MFVLGLIYFVAMTARLVIGLANLSALDWFHKPLPAIFHLVLAAFVLTLAAYHLDWVGKGNKFALDEEKR